MELSLLYWLLLGGRRLRTISVICIDSHALIRVGCCSCSYAQTVATDATDALAQLDENLDDDGGGGGQRESAPLIDSDTGIPLEVDEAEDEAGASAEENVSEEEMRDFLMTLEAVFLDELVTEREDDADNAAAKAFLENFDLETKTEEISQLLEANPDTLEQTFSQLTDRVEYADFWKRYFYRLSDDRLSQSYGYYFAAEKAQEEAAAKAKAAKRREAAAAAISGVTNFLGGVVNRLVEENNVDDIDQDEEIVNDDGTPFFRSRAGPATASAMSFLTGVAGGRPPFVLNTAMSDDDGDANEDDEEDEDEVEEEELGWDDDDDEMEDVDPGTDDGEDDKNETVEFKDAEKESLQEELEQAKVERDMLQKTVEMQAEEIKKLSEISRPEVAGDESKQVELLQMKIFEKDSELGALRAQLEDLRQDEDGAGDDKLYESEMAVAAATQEVGRLTLAVAEQDQEIALLKAEIEQYKDLQYQLDQSRAENETLRTQLSEMQKAGVQPPSEQIDQMLEEAIAKKDEEIITLSQRLQKVQDDAKTALEVQMNEALDGAKAAAEQAAAEATFMREDLVVAQSQIEELRVALDAGKSAVVDLEAELENTQIALREKESQLRTKLPSSPGSSSTGIKVSTSDDDDDEHPSAADQHNDAEIPPLGPPESSAPLAVVAKVHSSRESGNEDDGWGDDW